MPEPKPVNKILFDRVLKLLGQRCTVLLKSDTLYVCLIGDLNYCDIHEYFYLTTEGTVDPFHFHPTHLKWLDNEDSSRPRITLN